MKQPDLNRLRTQLLSSGLQKRDNPVFQVINQLLSAVKQLQSSFLADLSSISSSSSTVVIGSSNNQVTGFPGMLIGEAGEGESDIMIMTVGTSGTTTSTNGYWTLLTDGNVDETDFIFANGDPISMFIPS
jgi:hypothetical protein